MNYTTINMSGEVVIFKSILELEIQFMAESIILVVILPVLLVSPMVPLKCTKEKLV